MFGGERKILVPIRPRPQASEMFGFCPGVDSHPFKDRNPAPMGRNLKHPHPEFDSVGEIMMTVPCSSFPSPGPTRSGWLMDTPNHLWSYQ